jgi:hypothetical protein
MTKYVIEDEHGSTLSEGSVRNDDRAEQIAHRVADRLNQPVYLWLDDVGLAVEVVPIAAPELDL